MYMCQRRENGHNSFLKAFLNGEVFIYFGSSADMKSVHSLFKFFHFDFYMDISAKKYLESIMTYYINGRILLIEWRSRIQKSFLVNHFSILNMVLGMTKHNDFRDQYLSKIIFRIYTYKLCLKPIMRNSKKLFYSHSFIIIYNN